MRIGPFGLPELLLILLIILLVFGARKLPEIGSALGRGIRGFKTSLTGEDEQPTSKEKSASTRNSNEPPY